MIISSLSFLCEIYRAETKHACVETNMVTLPTMLRSFIRVELHDLCCHGNYSWFKACWGILVSEVFCGLTSWVCLNVRNFLWDLQSVRKTWVKINDSYCHVIFFRPKCFKLSKHLCNNEGCHLCVSAMAWLVPVTAGCIFFLPGLSGATSIFCQCHHLVGSCYYRWLLCCVLFYGFGFSSWVSLVTEGVVPHPSSMSATFWLVLLTTDCIFFWFDEFVFVTGCG